MANLSYGYLEGLRLLVPFKVKASETWVSDSIMSLDSNGYLQPAAAGENAIGFAFDPLVTAVSNDGDIELLVDISRETLYLFPPDEGTVTQALVGKTCDVGGVQSINIDATVDDCIFIRRVDTVNNLCIVSLQPIPAGV